MPPRRSLRGANSVATTPAKRSAPSTPGTNDSRSARKTSSPKKSKYFHTEESMAKDDDADVTSEPEEIDASSSDGEASGYEDEDASASELSEEVEEEEDAEEYDSEESERPRKKQKRAPNSAAKLTGNAQSGKPVKGQELWRPDVKTGLGPGTQVIIDKPKARLPGKVPYKDETIHPHTMLFLQELAENNDREWLKMHDPNYRQALNDSNSFFEALQTKIVEVDETIPELPLKDVIFRIYRDVRFSKDQTPYKTHFSVAWSRTGRKGPFAAYYCQIKPDGGTFIGGGLWAPEACAIAALRQDIDKKSMNLKNVLLGETLRKEFFGGIKKDEKLVVKAFTDHNKANALKSKPRDYPGDHKDIQLLRLRNFTIGRKLKDEEVVGDGGIDRIAEVIAALVPFVTYLNSIVMPDAPLQYSSDSDDDDDNDDPDNPDGEEAEADASEEEEEEEHEE